MCYHHNNKTIYIYIFFFDDRFGKTLEKVLKTQDVTNRDRESYQHALRLLCLPLCAE